MYKIPPAIAPPDITVTPTAASHWWVYIVATQSGKLYTGITTNVARRLVEHQGSVAKGARFFRSDPALHLVHYESAQNRSDASKREAQIKALSRVKKLALIEKYQPPAAH